MKNELGQLIRDARTKKGLTQLQLGIELGYKSMQFVSLFERGLSKVPFKVIGKLVLILGINEKSISKALTTEFQAELADQIEKGKIEWHQSKK